MAFHKVVNQMLARLLCSVVGHLAVISSQNDLDVLAPNSGAGYWVDLNDIETEGRWVTSLTGKASFINWRSSSEPSNATDEDCVIISNKEMHDIYCSAKRNFICKI